MAASPATNWEASLGHTFRVALVTGDEFTSVAFAFDAAAGAVVFRQSPHHTYQKADYRIVPLAAIASAVGLAVGETLSTPPVVPTKAAIDAKIASAERAELGRQATIAFGVSPLAQYVFNAVNKTLACRWSGERIVVTDKIVISPPYTVERVQVAAGVDAAAYATQVEYVRKIVVKALPAFQALQAGQELSPGGSP